MKLFWNNLDINFFFRIIFWLQINMEQTLKDIMDKYKKVNILWLD